MIRLTILFTIIVTLYGNCSLYGQEIHNQHIYQQKPIWSEHVIAPMVSHESPELLDIITDKNTIWYKLQKVYQHNGQVLTTEHKPEFNANKDFPWIGTAGLDEKAGPYNVINILRLPRGKSIAILYDEVPIKWIFPPGTEVGELILVYDKTTQKQYVLEARVRQKSEDNQLWDVKIYRRFKNEEHLKYVVNLYDRNLVSTWDQRTSNRFFFFRNIEDTEVMALSGKVKQIPDFSDDLVRKLLKQPLRNVTNERWESELENTTPTSNKEFNIIPKNYSFGIVPTDAESCARCHNQTGISVDKLIPKETIILKNPHLVGRIRGYDGVFSWYPFTQSSISKNDTDKKQILYREVDINNNIVKAYDPLLHKNYKLTSYVESALDPKIIPVLKEVVNGVSEKDRGFPQKYPVKID